MGGNSQNAEIVIELYFHGLIALNEKRLSISDNKPSCYGFHLLGNDTWRGLELGLFCPSTQLLESSLSGSEVSSIPVDIPLVPQEVVVIYLGMPGDL